MRKNSSCLLVLVALSMSLACTVPTAAQTPGSNYRIRAIETTVAPVLDGLLEEGVWGAGALIDGLTQQEPVEGAPATERTEIHLLYDAETLYIGVRAWDTGAVTAGIRTAFSTRTTSRSSSTRSATPAPGTCS